jgi:hypothetical protein
MFLPGSWTRGGNDVELGARVLRAVPGLAALRDDAHAAELKRTGAPSPLAYSARSQIRRASQAAMFST